MKYLLKRPLIIIACLCACATLTFAQTPTLQADSAVTPLLSEAVTPASASLTEEVSSSAEAVTSSTSNSFEEEASLSAVDRVTAWYSAHMNYGSITALMAVESSFIPFPSEVVVPPAAYVAGDEESPLHATDSYPINVLIIILFASLGAMIGAIINYGLSIWLGRPIIYRFADSRLGHLCLLSGEKLQKAEDYFNAHGKVSTLVGRMIPGIRQLISIPAGLARMHFGAFLLYTFIGAFAWNTILALLGYILHGQADLISQYSHEIGYLIVAVVALALLYLVCKRVLKRKK